MPNITINYENKTFTPQENSANGEVGGGTVFNYHQEGNVLWAEYAGGEVVRGHLIGTVADDGTLDFHYQHLNEEGKVRIGKCHSTPQVAEDGKLIMHEEWQWLNGDESTGTSLVVEI